MYTKKSRTVIVRMFVITFSAQAIQIGSILFQSTTKCFNYSIYDIAGLIAVLALIVILIRVLNTSP